MITNKRIQELIEKSWCSFTSTFPNEWTRDNPSWGQCAVTALIVQDYLGGKLIRVESNLGSHYYNQLPNGEDLDLTRSQFKGNYEESNRIIRTREYVLSFPDTVRRYELLKTTVSLCQQNAELMDIVVRLVDTITIAKDRFGDGVGWSVEKSCKFVREADTLLKQYEELIKRMGDD